MTDTAPSAPLALTSGQLPRFIEPMVLVGVAIVVAGLQLLFGASTIASVAHPHRGALPDRHRRRFPRSSRTAARPSTASCAGSSPRPSCSPSPADLDAVDRGLQGTRGRRTCSSSRRWAARRSTPTPSRSSATAGAWQADHGNAHHHGDRRPHLRVRSASWPPSTSSSTRSQQPAAPRHHLPRRRHDGHPLDRRRSLRVLAVQPIVGPKASAGSRHPSPSPC